MADRLEQNKQNAIAFYDLAFNQGQPAEAVARYVGDVLHRMDAGTPEPEDVDWDALNASVAEESADGEVVAVHAAGLREAAGLGFAVPVRLVLPLLPEDAQREVRR